MNLPPLPVLDVVAELKNCLQSQSAVLSAPPGSGKTTVLPLALLDEPWLEGRKIVILEPRRLAATAAATRMASLCGESVGQTVGYHIRFDRQVSKRTRIEVITEGILTRRLQTNPDLPGVGLIIFDEFHERSLHADLALALCLDLCQVKDDLRLLVMSATVETRPISDLLGKVPIITGGGKCFEVKIEYLNHTSTGRIADKTVAGIRRVMSDHLGDILVFLPGAGEIKEVYRKLRTDSFFGDTLVLPLYSDLSKQDQVRAISPNQGGRRRIILSTSIAETSLTIEGITCVIDSGWSRLPRFDPGSGLSKLVTVPVSRASADQRTGRAGRIGPGYCLRLYTKEEHYNLPAYHPPEILSVDLTDLILELALWGINNPHDLSWLDPPRHGSFIQAQRLLHSLGAINETGKITETGRLLAILPVHPRLGHMLLKAKQSGQGALGCDLAALLTEPDIMNNRFRQGNCELQTRYNLLQEWRKNGQEVAQRGAIPELCRRIDKTAHRFIQILGCKAGDGDAENIADLLTYAYPDRIAKKQKNDPFRYLLSTGRAVMLDRTDPLATSEYLIVPKLDSGLKQGRIHLAEPVNIEDIIASHGNLFSDIRSVTWDSSSERVRATLTTMLNKIIICEQPLKDLKTEEIEQTMVLGIKRMGIECLPWDRAARQFQARVDCVRHQYPQDQWPDLSDERLLKDLNWLTPFLHTMNTREKLKQLDLCTIFKSMLGWEKSQILDRIAPRVFKVPSGSQLFIDYQCGKIPTLAVRIQEILGLDKSPAICNGRITLLLHLLSPAQRPIQITTDLYGFWRNSYPEIKKELKGRYPKHYWPDDPLNAEPIRGVRKKIDLTH
ncbi:MAG: ATP-dependent helicase HrpB [Desulforhopalus sp.]